MDNNQNRAIGISLLAILIIWSVNGVYLSALSHLSVTAYWVADLLQWIVVPSCLLYWLTISNKVPPRQYGFALVSKSWAITIAFGLLAALVFSLCFFLARNFAWRHLGQPTGYFSLASVFPQGPLGTVAWLYAAVSAGFIESIFFIGLPWLLWSRLGFGRPSAFCLLSSVVFALVHWEQGPHAIFGALAFGLVACYWFLELRSLWPVVIGHAIVDLIAFN